MLKHMIDISLLKQNRQYALLYIGQFITFIGTMLTSVALPYQTYSITKSTVMVGLLSLSQLIPLLFTALLGGILADRYNRRTLVMFSEIILTIGCIFLTINAASASPSLTLIFIVSSIMSATTGIHRPAIESMTQQLVESKHFKAVGALVSFKFSFCLIAGPALAGLLIAEYSLVFTYVLDILTFAFSLLCLLLMRKTKAPRNQNHPSIFRSLHEGLEFAFKRQELLGSYVVDFIAMLCAIPNALFPAIAENYGSTKFLGILYSAPAVGSLLISFFSGWTSNIKSYGKAIAITSALFGAAIIGFGFSTNIYLALLFLAIAGAFDAVSGIFRSVLWNTTIPQDKRGRLAGIEMISYLSGPRLGDTRSGLFAAWLGITAAVTSGGVLCIIGVVLCTSKLPKFWNYSANESNT